MPERLNRSWRRTWSQLGATPRAGLFDEIVERYREAHRLYHTLQHLAECIAHVEAAADLAEHPGEVEAACWFHDAVYEIGRDDNEERSAQWARRELQAAGASHERCARVHALVLATRHAGAPATADECLLTGADLAILGADPARFDEYQRQLRDEHAAVPEGVWRIARKAVLESFLARAPLYCTRRFRDRLETQARENLRRAIQAL